MAKYEKPKAGEWVYPRKKGYKMACCDCGLVHSVDFKLVKRSLGKAILFRVFHDNRATAATRENERRRKAKQEQSSSGD